MNNPESPEQKADLADARIMWAARFLMDWLVHQVQLNRIDSPSDIIQLRKEFPPREAKGTDFTIHDVWVAAVRWRENNYEVPFPNDLLPSHKELDYLVDLLEKDYRINRRSAHSR